MSDLALARVLHVLGVVLWIGGLAFVTLVLQPGLRDLRRPGSGSGDDAHAAFAVFERRFARQARYTTQLTGLSGLYMVWRLDLWSRFAEPAFWWMDAMLLLYLFFTAMLFVLEPFVLRRRRRAASAGDPEASLRAMLRLHRALLAASLLTIAGAVAGSHGWLIGRG